MKNEITVELLENGKVYLCKMLDENPLGQALGMIFKPDSDKDLGEAVMEMLIDKGT